MFVYKWRELFPSKLWTIVCDKFLDFHTMQKHNLKAIYDTWDRKVRYVFNF